MKIQVNAKPKKKKEYVEQVTAIQYIAAVKEPAQQGKANRAITQALAKYFGVPEKQIILISGQTAK